MKTFLSSRISNFGARRPRFSGRTWLCHSLSHSKILDHEIHMVMVIQLDNSLTKSVERVTSRMGVDVHTSRLAYHLRMYLGLHEYLLQALL